MFKENTPIQLKDFHYLHQEFIPFLLNYLRDQTIHLLQSSKSTTPSPAKTPSAQKLRKCVVEEKGSSASTSSKRIQLFGASPCDGIDDIKPTTGSFFSPNTSVEIKTPSLKTPTNQDKVGKGDKKSTSLCNQQTPAGRNSAERDHKLKGGRGNTPHSGSKGNQDGRSKHRFSLGEFLVSPEVTSSTGKRKNSPFSGKKNEKINDNSPSPILSNVKSGYKKRHSVETENPNCGQPAPVFSLGSTDEFPPVGCDSKQVTPRLEMY